MDSFVATLRNSIKENQTYSLKDDRNAVVDINVATKISFASGTFTLSAPGGYKEYDCWTILYYYQNASLDHPQYLQKLTSIGKNTMVSFMDRNDLLQYLKGGSSIHVGTVVAAQGGDDDVYGFNLAKKQRLVTPDMLKDLEDVRRIERLERPILNRDTVLCVNVSRVPFTHVVVHVN
jgi:hypothetical protein